MTRLLKLQEREDSGKTAGGGWRLLCRKGKALCLREAEEEGAGGRSWSGQGLGGLAHRRWTCRGLRAGISQVSHLC